jgi:apolipoprotein D and lipocalin family protein
MKRMIFPVFGILLTLAGCTKPPETPLPTVEAVDLQRYGGTWYEIARYENRFEKGCVAATATYTPTEEGVGVLNRCYDAEGRPAGSAEGKARVVEGSNGSKLEVSFFWPFYGDYWVVMLADDYRYSVVGEPRRKYLWILARDKMLDAADRETILRRLPGLGYDPDVLYWTTFGPAFD